MSREYFNGATILIINKPQRRRLGQHKLLCWIINRRYRSDL